MIEEIFQDGVKIGEINHPDLSIVTVSKLEFMNRLTQEELIAIYTAAKTSVQIEIFLAKFNVAPDEIHLDNPELIASLTAMESAGILAVGRAAQITQL